MRILQQWLESRRTLTIPEAEALTGIWGVLIAISILHHDPALRLKSLRKGDVLRWAERFRVHLSSSMIRRK